MSLSQYQAASLRPSRFHDNKVLVEDKEHPTSAQQKGKSNKLSSNKMRLSNLVDVETTYSVILAQKSAKAAEN